MKIKDFNEIIGKEFRATVWVIMWGKYPIVAYTSKQEAKRVLGLMRKDTSIWQRILPHSQVYIFAVRMIA